MVMDHVGAGFRALQCASVSSGRRLTHLATGRLPSALLGLFERRDQRAKSRMAIVSSATNEERRGAVDTASDTAHEVFFNSTRMDVLSHLLLKPLHIELEFLRIVREESMVGQGCLRSEERRVGKECRSRW